MGIMEFVRLLQPISKRTTFRPLVDCLERERGFEPPTLCWEAFTPERCASKLEAGANLSSYPLVKWLKLPTSAGFAGSTCPLPEIVRWVSEGHFGKVIGPSLYTNRV